LPLLNPKAALPSGRLNLNQNHPAWDNLMILAPLSSRESPSATLAAKRTRRAPDKAASFTDNGTKVVNFWKEMVKNYRNRLSDVHEGYLEKLKGGDS
jgi:hypothetical protein